MTPTPDERLRRLAAAHWRIATSLSAAMITVYFGFILLIAFDRPLMGRLLVPGLSVGILLGALVIACTWAFTWIYVRWANIHYDAELKQLKE